MTDSSSRSPGTSVPGERPIEPAVSPTGARGRRIGELLFAGGTVALGVYAIVGAAAVRVPGSTNTLGPQAFPYLVGAMLTLSGLAVAFQAARGRLGDPESGEDIDPDSRTDWVTVAKLLGFFLAHALLISLIGWPLAAGLLFAGSAWSLGARHWWRAALAGLGLGLLVQLVFGTGLGLSLPPGPLLDWIPFF
jgi:putative tricarboxylic transport membrane protein